MSAIKETFKTTFKWFGIFMAGTLLATGMAFFNQGGGAAAEKLVGLGGATILVSAIIFVYSLFSNLLSKKTAPQEHEPD